jgi:hypothetical protein
LIYYYRNKIELTNTNTNTNSNSHNNNCSSSGNKITKQKEDAMLLQNGFNFTPSINNKSRTLAANHDKRLIQSLSAKNIINVNSTINRNIFFKNNPQNNLFLRNTGN